jgi:hypothetical protein
LYSPLGICRRLRLASLPGLIRLAWLCALAGTAAGEGQHGLARQHGPGEPAARQGLKGGEQQRDSDGRPA